MAIVSPWDYYDQYYPTQPPVNPWEVPAGSEGVPSDQFAPWDYPGYYDARGYGDPFGRDNPIWGWQDRIPPPAGGANIPWDPNNPSGIVDPSLVRPEYDPYAPTLNPGAPEIPYDPTQALDVFPHWQSFYNPYYTSVGGRLRVNEPGGMAFTSADPLQMAEQNRMLGGSWMLANDEAIRRAMERYENLEGGFLNESMFGPGGYGNILAGQTGFDPTQKQNLLQEDLLYGGFASPEEYDQFYLHPDEQGAIMGAPYAPFDLTGGQLQALQSISGEGHTRQREAFGPGGYLEDPLRSAIDPTALRMSPGYGPAAGQAIGDLASGYGSVLDPNLLTLSPEFQGDFRVTPQDLQDIESQAGRTVGMQTQAQIDALKRRAAAEGNVNPLALEASVNESKLRGDIGAGEAMTDARIRARQLGLDTSRTREAMRLGAESGFAGMQTGAYENLAGTQLNELARQESMRQAAERDVANRLMSTASEVGQSRLATERGIGSDRTANQRYSTDMLANLMRYGESEAARRGANLAGQRTGTARDIASTRYGQFYPASQALSSRYGNIYGQQKAEEQEGRGFLNTLRGDYLGAGQVGRGQRIQSAGTGFGAIAPATQQATQAHIFRQATPKAWEKALSAGLGFLGGYTGGG